MARKKTVLADYSPKDFRALASRIKRSWAAAEAMALTLEQEGIGSLPCSNSSTLETGLEYMEAFLRAADKSLNNAIFDRNGTE